MHPHGMYTRALVVGLFLCLSGCALEGDAPESTPAEVGSVLIAPSEAICSNEDDCEVHPEQTLSQCLTACTLGTAAIEAFCRIILNPVIRAACWGVVNQGPQACANFCHWYFTP